MIEKLSEIGIHYGMKMNVEKMNMMRISKVTITNTGQRQLENVQYFNHLGSMITNDAICRHEIKSRIAMAKPEFNRKKTLHQQIRLKNNEKTSRVLQNKYSFVQCWNLDTSENRSEIPGKYLNVVLEKNGEDKFDQSCKEWSSVTNSQEGQKHPTQNKKMESKMSWSHLEEELPSTTLYLRKDRAKDRSNRKKWKKIYAAAGWT